MNLNAIAAPIVAAINPLITLQVQLCTGFTVAEDGSQVPTYANPVSMLGQVQPLSTDNIKHLEALNIQGAQRRVYVNGALSGIQRIAGKGGDLLKTPDSNTWLVLCVFEAWPNWTMAAIVLQDGS